jgi:hypothetical protein
VVPVEDRFTWDLYWLLRDSIAADAGIDYEAALRLHDRLYGTTNAMDLVALLAAMDRAFQSFRSELTNENEG